MHAKLLAPLIRTFDAGFFAPDLRFLNLPGKEKGIREAKADMLDFEDTNKGPGSFLRKAFKLRVSGRKAFRLARRLIREADELEE